MPCASSYIDLAIRHLDHGLAEARRVLREIGAPERSWILFFDAHLVEEWLGVYDSTSSPPARDSDDEDSDDEDSDDEDSDDE